MTTENDKNDARDETIDPAKLERLAGIMTRDMASATTVATTRIGLHLGLYAAMRGHPPMTSVELAEQTQLSERMIREWLLNQAASEYLSHVHVDGDDRFYLSPEQAALLGDIDHPRCMHGGFQATLAMAKADEPIAESFRHGRGMSWGDHHSDLHEGVARFFNGVYATQLVDDWLPRAPGLIDRLRAGASVADVGCGYGFSTVVMAERFENSQFFGFDAHPPSVERGNRVAADKGLAERCRFEVFNARDFPDRQYDLVAIFNCLHDVGRYDEAARHIHEVLKPDGFLFMMEPMGGHTVADNFNLVGRLMSGSSVMCCTPQGVADGGDGLGTVVTDARLTEVLLGAGFQSFERVGETRFNRLFVGRP